MFTKWRKYGKPIVDVGTKDTFDSVLVCIPSVLKEDHHYKMWYTAHNGKDFRVGLALSKDGVNFTKYESNPVLDVTPNCWDSQGVQFAQVLKESDGYKMWYAGYDRPKSRGQKIGFAVSEDGIRWTKEREPVLNLGGNGDFDERILLKPSVIRDGAVYRMVYAALAADMTMRLGLATSPDGKKWTKYSGNPILVPDTGSWDAVHIEDPHLLKVAGKYHLSYAGRDQKNYRIGLATSKDGAHFTKITNPILDLGNADSFEATYVAGNYIFYDPPKVIMYYHGRDAMKKERISLAWCEDTQ